MAALIIIWAMKNVLYYVKAVTKYMAIGNVRLSKVGTFFFLTPTTRSGGDMMEIRTVSTKSVDLVNQTLLCKVK